MAVRRDKREKKGKRLGGRDGHARQEGRVSWRERKSDQDPDLNLKSLLI